MVINGVELVAHDPSAIFKNHKEIKAALFEALMDVEKFVNFEVVA